MRVQVLGLRRPVVTVRMPVAVIVVMMIMIMVVMIMGVAPQGVVVGIAMHAQGPGGMVTGLSMIALCLPSVPWLTIEPSTSTMTRVASRAVMSDVS